MEKKRILIVNKFYYPRGGDCIVAVNLERLLKEQGHDVAVFAMQYSKNVNSGWNHYYASQVNFDGNLSAKFKAARRIFGWGDIKQSFNKILDDFNPDIVHLHNIHSYLSPVVARLAKLHGCRVVWTLHDHKLVCPSYLCLCNGKPCERCIGRSKKPVINMRCMKGSFIASFMAYLEARRWNANVINNLTDAFICPSQALAKKMIKDGFDQSKLHVVCNHIDPEKLDIINATSYERDNYYTYIGRLAPEKGIETLLWVAAKLPYTLKIAGDGPLFSQLKQQYSTVSNIEFLGRLNARQVTELLSKAQFSVMPSECYDNNPLGVIESLCAGTPVVGARIGGIPELLDENNGITFTSGSKKDLSNSIKMAFDKQWSNNTIKDMAIKHFSTEEHLRLIEDIYQSI